MNQDTFCIMTHKGFFVEPTKHVKPCCVFKDFDIPVIYDENKSFDELLNSPQFIDLREKMDNGIVHKGCENCFNGTINQLITCTIGGGLNSLELFSSNLPTSAEQFPGRQLYNSIKAFTGYGAMWGGNLRKKGIRRGSTSARLLNC